MLNPSVSNFPTNPGASSPIGPAGWNEVVRLCRRICVLQERGDHAGAETIRSGALAAAVSALRPTVPDVDAQLEAVLRTERDRVVNAALVAEFLAPQLREPNAAAPAAPPATELAAPTDDRAAPANAEPKRRPADIADFIDEMLAQERPRRRAS